MLGQELGDTEGRGLVGANGRGRAFCPVLLAECTGLNVADPSRQPLAWLLTRVCGSPLRLLWK